MQQKNTDENSVNGDIAELFSKGLQHYKEGRLQQAQDFCQRIVQKQQFPDALLILGMIAHQQGELFDYCDQKISQKCITFDGSEWGITGRFCRITPLDGIYWDLWLCNPKKIADGLSQRMVTSKIAVLEEKSPQKLHFTVLTGEAYTQGATKELILETLSLLGIPRKRRVSEEQRHKLAARLKELRAA